MKSLILISENLGVESLSLEEMFTVDGGDGWETLGYAVGTVWGYVSESVENIIAGMEQAAKDRNPHKK